MLMCNDKNCTCIHRRLRDCLKRERDNESILLLYDIKNINEVADRSGLTLLHHAVKNRNPTMVSHLINEGCDVNAEDIRGKTPLMTALSKKSPLIAQILLENHANIYGSMSKLESIVKCSLKGDDKVGYQKVLKLFFDQVNNNFLENKQRMARLLLVTENIVKFAAVVFGNVELAKILLESGYPIDFKEPETGYTALHWAVMFAKIKNAKFLIEHGANINAFNGIKYTPLYYYSNNSELADENAKLLHILLKYSAISTVPDVRYGTTFVEHLVTNFKKQTVRALLTSGIDVVWYSYEGRSLLHQLIENKNDDIIDLLEELDIKFKVNDRAPNGDTPLIRATRMGSIKKVEFLLKHGADVNLSFNGKTALFYATNRAFIMDPSEKKLYAKITELLLQHGASAQLVYENKTSFIDIYSIYEQELSAKVVIAHLALLLEKNDVLPDFTHKEIESDPNLKADLAVCTLQLEEMKYIKVHGTLSLFQLLSETDERVAKLTRNQQFITAFDNTMKSVPHLDSYYYNTLRKKIENAVNKNKLDEKAVVATELLTGICSEAYYDVVCEIISYLNLQDLLSLSKVQNKIFVDKSVAIRKKDISPIFENFEILSTYFSHNG